MYTATVTFLDKTEYEYTVDRCFLNDLGVYVLVRNEKVLCYINASQVKKIYLKEARR